MKKNELEGKVRKFFREGKSQQWVDGYLQGLLDCNEERLEELKKLEKTL